MFIDDANNSLPLTAGRYTIGRDSECEIPLNPEYRDISRKHMMNRCGRSTTGPADGCLFAGFFCTHVFYRSHGTCRDEEISRRRCGSRRVAGYSNLDRDWVIVGAHIDDVKQTGLRLHDETFGIFVDDQTGDEFALARRERKTADGHRGFEVQNGVDISLEEDLKRRDFTINAIAQSEDGTYVDPYGGRSDLDARWLEHVSPAFNEDPLRVWRGARFLEPSERISISSSSNHLDRTAQNDWIW